MPTERAQILKAGSWTESRTAFQAGLPHQAPVLTSTRDLIRHAHSPQESTSSRPFSIDASAVPGELTPPFGPASRGTDWPEEPDGRDRDLAPHRIAPGSRIAQTRGQAMSILRRVFSRFPVESSMFRSRRAGEGRGRGNQG